MSAFTTPIHHCIGNPSHRNHTKNVIKHISIGKEETKLSLITDNMIIYIENPIDSTKKVFNLVSEFGKTVDSKSIFRN